MSKDVTVVDGVPSEADLFAAGQPEQGLSFGTLWRQKSLLLLGAVAGLVIGAIYFSRSPPEYLSTAQVLLVKKGAGGAAGSVHESVLSYMEDFVSAQVALIKSPLLVQQAVADAKLGTLESFAGRTDPTREIISALKVDTLDKGSTTNLLNVSYRGPNSEDCRVVLASVVDSYQKFLDQTYETGNKGTLELVTVKANELQKELRDLAKQREKLISEAPKLWKSGEEGSYSDGRLSAIEAKRSELRIRRADIQSRLEQLTQGLPQRNEHERLLAMIAQWTDEKRDGANESELEASLVPLKLEEAMLLEKFGPDHPKIRTVRKQIQFLSENALTVAASAGSQTSTEAIQTYIAHLEQDLADTERNEQELNKLFDQEHQQSQGIMQFDLKEKQLSRDISRTEQFYEGLLTQLKEIDLGKDFGGYNATLIAPPTDGSQIAPKLPNILMISLVLGLLGGAAMAYVAESVDKNFRSPDEIRRRLGVSVVGCLPPIRASQQLAASGQALDPMLCCYHRPKSPEAESFRTIRTVLYFSARGGNCRVIQITSPSAGDGKSTIAANLAICIAQSGKKVLLIDADLRKPRVREIFDISQELGLVSLITDDADFSDAICETPIEGLTVLPSGPTPSNPSELLTSARFEELLEMVRTRYDFVIVDTPPILAVSDSAMVAARADATLLTIRVGKSKRSEAERASELIHEIQSTLLGVIVNGMDGQHMLAKYGYNDHRYGYESDDTDGEADDHDENSQGKSPASSKRPALTQPAALLKKTRAGWQKNLAAKIFSMAKGSG